jgi:hypothetical protein
MNQPNPAQQRRSALMQAVAAQQTVLEEQAQQITALHQAVATLAVAAGVGAHPRFAGLVRAAGLRVQADSDTNEGDSIGGTPATTTEEAKKPDATADVEQIGSVPAPANKGVTPEGVTDVQNTDVVANPPVLDNLQDVTKPVSGTDSVVPAAGDAGGASKVEVGTPSSNVMDPAGSSGWKNSSLGDPQERFMAGIRLARLQIRAGLAQGEDIALGQRIAESQTPLGEIQAQVNTLEALAARSTQPSGQETRHLVPRAAARQGITPAAQRAVPSFQAEGASREGEDEWMLGMDI